MAFEFELRNYQGLGLWKFEKRGIKVMGNWKVVGDAARRDWC
jgi:hypothetical protein